MAEFIYNNIKNTNNSDILFELNYRYHPRVLFKDKTNSHLRSNSTNKLAEELRELIKIYC